MFLNNNGIKYNIEANIKSPYRQGIGNYDEEENSKTEVLSNPY